MLLLKIILPFNCVESKQVQNGTEYWVSCRVAIMYNIRSSEEGEWSLLMASHIWQVSWSQERQNLNYVKKF